MRFRSARLKLFSGERLDIVPFINCFFLLLIFLLLAWNYTILSESAIRVSLPKAVTSETVADLGLVITITREKLIYLNDEVVTTKELASKLKGLADKKPLLIRADRGTSLERVVEVWDICRNAGIPHVNIATTPVRE